VAIAGTALGTEIFLTMDGKTPLTSGAQYRGPIQVSGSIILKAVAVAPGYLPSAPVTAAYTITSSPVATIGTVMGDGNYGVPQAGALAVNSEVGYLSGIAVDRNQNIYIPDPSNAVVWMISAKTGTLQVVAGTFGVSGVAGDGGLATSAQLWWPARVAVDDAGDLYISEPYANQVRKVTASTGIISLYAGSGAYGYGPLGDGGPATSAVLRSPQGLAVDSSGNLYITDQGNSLVRKVTLDGNISTVAGAQSASDLGDGGLATSAFLSQPADVAVDSHGDLYIADAGNARVRMVSAQSGLISTVAGNGDRGSSGDGGQGTAAEVVPQALALDNAGNLYISDSPNSVRKLDRGTGLISTFAGSGFYGFNGDGISATLANLCGPAGLAADSSASVYIVDACNYRVRKVTVLPTTPAPVLSLAGGTYPTAQTLTMTDSLATGKIFYTKDGTDPYSTSTVYTAPISIRSSETVKAIAVADGYAPSPVVSASYVIEGPAAMPQFNPPAGTYTSVQTVTISDTTQGAAIYYTVDGTNPTPASTLYSGPIMVSSSETIKALATANGFTPSAVATASYTINLSAPAPTISGLSPGFTSAGSAGFTLTVTGTAFTSNSNVYWNGTALTTQYKSAAELQAQVPASNISNAGVASVTVQTPGPGGGTSNAFKFQVDSAGTPAPSFTTDTATVSPGSSASFAVTPPASATNISATCLNLPTGATCSYAAGAVTITTTSSTPKGTYAITVVFTETLPGAAAAAGMILPFLVLPLAWGRRRSGARPMLTTAFLGLAIVLAVAVSGCGGGGTSSSPTPPQTHQATASGSVTLIVQ
jgi:hypothetical protein